MTTPTFRILIIVTFLTGVTNFSYAQSTPKTQAPTQKLATCKHCGKASCNKNCSSESNETTADSTQQNKAVPLPIPNLKKSKKRRC